jgi:hypothetical protein
LFRISDFEFRIFYLSDILACPGINKPNRAR